MREGGKKRSRRGRKEGIEEKERDRRKREGRREEVYRGIELSRGVEIVLKLSHTIAPQEVVKVHKVVSIDTRFIVTGSKIISNIIPGTPAMNN